MEFSFRGHQFLAHWIPGLVFVCMLYVCDRHYDFGCVDHLESVLVLRRPKVVVVPTAITSTNAIGTGHPLPAAANQVSKRETSPEPPSEVFVEKSFALLLFVAAAFVFGQFIDSLRDIAEDGVWLFGKGKIHWKKIIKMSPDERQAWDDYFSRRGVARRGVGS